MNKRLKNFIYCLSSLAVLFVLFGCGQSKEELFEQGNQVSDEGNYRGAIVLFKSALEKDANYLEARIGLADTYLATGSFDKAENEYKKVLHQNPTAKELLLKLAKVHLGQQKPASALLVLDEYHSSMPESSASLTLYGQAHGASGDLASAEIYFKKALQLQPDAIPPRINLAKVYLQHQNVIDARQLLKAIILQDKSTVEAYYLLAGIETRDGQRDAALEVYQSLVAVQPLELQALYMIGLLQIDKGNFKEAQQSVDTLLTTFKDRPEGLRLKGLLLYHQGEFTQAVQTFETSIRQQPHLLTYFFMGLSHFNLDQLELALNNFQKALDLDPDFERARILVAMTLLKQERVDDAITEISKILRTNPDNGYAHNILGSAYLAKGQFDDGMAELERATEIDPGLADAHLKRGIFHLAKGEGVQGEIDLVKAVAAAPEVLNSRLMLVTHYLRQKNYSAAIETLQAGMDGSPADALLGNYLAAAYFSQKKPELALQALQKAKLANSAYLTPYFNLASYYATKADYPKALTEYQSVLQLDNKNIKALFGMAAIYNLQGLPAELDKIYQKLEATGVEEGFVAAATYQIKQKKFVEALAIVERGLDQYKTAPALLEIEGGLYLQQKQFEKAESSFIRLSGVAPERGSEFLLRLYLSNNQLDNAKALVADLLKSSSDQDYAYLLASGLALSQKQPEEAIKLLQQGSERVKNKLRIQMQLAGVYQGKGAVQQAEQTYQQVVEEFPRFSPAYTSLGFINEARGDKGKALDLYRLALKYDANNVSALNNLAYLLTDNFGQEKEALDLAMLAYLNQSNDPRIMDTLGYVLLKNKRPDNAVTLLEHAVKLLPGAATVKLHLAMAQLGVKQQEKARVLLTEVVASGAEPEVKQAQALLKNL